MGDLTSSLRSVVEELVATRVLAAETLLSTELVARDEAENEQVSERVGAIDAELREHAIAAARAAAARDREMPIDRGGAGCGACGTRTTGYTSTPWPRRRRRRYQKPLNRPRGAQMRTILDLFGGF